MAVSILGSTITGIVGSRTLTTISDSVYVFSTGLTDTDNTISTNDSEIDHDSLNNFVSNEHIDWTSTSSNLSTSGTITGGAGTLDDISLTTGATVDNIETTITNDDTHIPTSGAVVDYVIGSVASNSGIYVRKQIIPFDDAGPHTIISLDGFDVIWDIKIYVNESYDGSGDAFVLIGKDADADYFLDEGDAAASPGWLSPIWVIDPTNEAPFTGATDITTQVTHSGTAPSQGEVSVFIWYSILTS